MDQYDIAKEMYKKGYSLRHIENELGINRKHGNKRKLNGKAKSINFSGNIQVKKISNFLYKNATIYLKRKQQKMPS